MEELKLVPVFTGPPNEFPSSPELPDGVKSVRWEDEPANMVDYRLDVVYDERDGEKLHLQILRPIDFMEMFGAPPTKRPLIVYVPGSAWMRQNVKMFISRMTHICERGFAVAMVEYRPSDVAPFPAQIEDAKTAVRFMRKHAEEYSIDPDRIAFWGDSSGGHTVATAGISGDGILDNGTYNEFSSEVRCIVNWFGPTDVSKMGYYPSMMDHTLIESPESMFLGGINAVDHPELGEKASPMYYLSREKATPPMLIMHGSKDELVPFNQSVRLYDKLRELDKDVVMYKLEDAMHGTFGFNSKEARDVVIDYISQHLK